LVILLSIFPYRVESPDHPFSAARSEFDVDDVYIVFDVGGVNIGAREVSMSRTRPEAASPAQPYHHGDLRRTLIDTALAMVTEEGAWNFTLREIARRAGVSHAAPYNHFPDRCALLAAVATEGFEVLRREMEEAARRPRSSRQALRGIAVAYVRFGVERPAHYRLMFGAELSDNDRYPQLREASEAAFAALTSALERGQASGELRRGPVRAQALSAWSLVHGLTMLLIDRRVSFPGVTAEEAARQARLACTALLNGLSASQE
jgi:AcrR family transcriptional regulator